MNHSLFPILRPDRGSHLSSRLILVITLFITMMFSSPSAFTAGADEIPTPDLEKVQVPFLANRGQFPDQVLCYARTFAGTVFVTQEGSIVYALPHADPSTEIKGWCLEESLVNGSAGPIKREDPGTASVNSFKGNDPRRWQSDIPSYRNLDLGEVYEGIDLKLSVQGNNVEKVFTVRPGADPGVVKVRIRGAEALKVGEHGLLEIQTGLGKIKFSRPVAWQEVAGVRRPVEISYCVEGLCYGFKVGDYDRGKALWIDPLLAATFHGTAGEEKNGALTLGPDGSVYVAGYTDSIDFPTTPGALMESHNGGTYDAYICKFDADLTTMLACTYIGGSDEEGTYYIALTHDADGNIYIVGNTSSNDFPTTTGALDESYNGGPVSGPYGPGGDLFISKLDAGLSMLLASTFLGGGGLEYCRSIVLDGSGNVYVSGSTSSGNFPTKPGAYSEVRKYGGNYNLDACVAVLDANLTTLVTGTYVGGTGDDFTESVRLDPSGNIFITGWTQSQDYPTTPGALEEKYLGGMYDAFLTKLSNDLTTLGGSTYMGGKNWDFTYAMDVDDTGSVYVAGHTYSNDYPTTTGAFDESFNGVGGAGYGDDIYLSKMSNDLVTLQASTFLGGKKFDHATSLVVDGAGSVYLFGLTSSKEYPTTPCAYDRSFNGGPVKRGDMIISKLDDDLASLEASTYLGGSGADNGYSACLALSPDGDVYVAGYTASSDYPMVAGCYCVGYNGGSCDAVVARLDGMLSADPSLEPDVFEIPENTGGSIDFQLSPGPDYANREYLLLGSVSGTVPGTALPGGLVNLPLNLDVFTDVVLLLLNTQVFADFYGSLDAAGSAMAHLNAGPVPGYAGTQIYFAFCLNKPFDFVSNPVTIEIVP
ncbi:MAG: DUF7948 domain-containing protein [Planctomycetota bacterium]|jgi:hypothetical protein